MCNKSPVPTGTSWGLRWFLRGEFLDFLVGLLRSFGFLLGDLLGVQYRNGTQH